MADKFENGQQDESYGVFGNNCESKSNEIATGVKFSQLFKLAIWSIRVSKEHITDMCANPLI
jgi:hypothetical protein